jgi:drug/metabolite transporter (DMT)-like permease
VPEELSIDRPMPLARQHALVIVSMLALYVIWGSTYFAMSVAIHFLPPFLMCGTRFAVAGALLFGFLRLRGVPAPSAKGWGISLLIGTLLLVCGNGFVAIAERSVESGVAATVVATVPLWAALIGAISGERPSRLEVFGLLLGFAGVAVLNRGGDLMSHGVDTIAIIIAPIAWALGSMWSRRLPVPSGLMGTAAQMLIAGVLFFLLALVTGERALQAPTFSAIGALAYLVVFGSLLAISA